MNYITVERVHPWFRKSYWTATWNNGGRTFIHGFYKTDTKSFATLLDLLKWARENYRSLDCHPGGGFGVGVAVCLDKMKIGEYWDKRVYKDGDVIGWQAISITYPIGMS